MFDKLIYYNTNSTALRLLLFLLLLGSLATMVLGSVRMGLHVGVIIAFSPLLLMGSLAVLLFPFCSFLALFTTNYFIMAAFRYSYASGLSLVIDVLILISFASLLLNLAGRTKRYNSIQMNGLILASLLWLFYCILQLLNPTAETELWVLSRGLSSYFFAIVLITKFIFRSLKEVKIVVCLLSVFTLIAVAKGAVQQFIGFDTAEIHFLNTVGGTTHLLLTGIRYFSIFPSAGIYGAIMGHALTLFLITAYYSNRWWERLYYLVVAGCALYALLASGTRGALAVPLAGLFLFMILSKKIRIMIPLLILLAGTYLFFTQTMIGQGNQYIRRMRTAFDPNEPSLVVRKENQKLFAEYLKDRPFGEGLGVSGVDVKTENDHFTTTLPTDSWYVKIWAETGIVGLTLHLAILAYIILYGSYLILFRIRSQSLRGVLTALHSGTFGILVASYGNQVLGQFPVAIIIYMSMGLVFLGPVLDRKMIEQGEAADKQKRPII